MREGGITLNLLYFSLFLTTVAIAVYASYRHDVLLDKYEAQKKRIDSLENENHDQRLQIATLHRRTALDKASKDATIRRTLSNTFPSVYRTDPTL